jgi:hypothetical protein
MSEQEQYIAIGRLVSERSDVKSQRALLQDEIRQRGEKLSALAIHLARIDSPERLAFASDALNDLTAAGGLDRLKAIVADYRVLTQRAGELNATLRAAGIE